MSSPCHSLPESAVPAFEWPEDPTALALVATVTRRCALFHGHFGAHAFGGFTTPVVAFFCVDAVLTAVETRSCHGLNPLRRRCVNLFRILKCKLYTLPSILSSPGRNYLIFRHQPGLDALDSIISAESKCSFRM